MKKINTILIVLNIFSVLGIFLLPFNYMHYRNSQLDPSKDFEVIEANVTKFSCKVIPIRKSNHVNLKIAVKLEGFSSLYILSTDIFENEFRCLGLRKLLVNNYNRIHLRKHKTVIAELTIGDTTIAGVKQWRENERFLFWMGSCVSFLSLIFIYLYYIHPRIRNKSRYTTPK